MVRGGRVEGVTLEGGATLHARAVVVTAGTFLNGLIHVGPEKTPAGRFGERPSRRLAASLKALGFRWGRLKTGTPPRLHRLTVDFAVLQPQFGDHPAVPFSFLTDSIERRQIVCHLLHTTERVHDLVRANIAHSPLYNGQIEGIGPRYCPSLEDKVMRFPDKERHQIVLEPEGLDVDEVYVNGFSMSLPPEVQLALVRALPGLSRAEMIRPGYAVEYDFVQPTELRRTMETREVAGLFLAGQVNGTSGYEEAAGQGILAGINAALTVREREPLVVGRDEAYIGVMVDDLTTQGCLEPYRMFTSRAEYRLLLRADNADRRLTPVGRRLGFVGDHRWRRYEQRQARLQSWRDRLDAVLVRSAEGHRLPAAQLLRRPDVRLAELIASGELGHTQCTDALEQLSVETDIKYEGYLRRQAAEVLRARRNEERRLPTSFPYETVPGLSREVRQRLSQIAPETLGQASRIPGMTPAAVAILARFLERGLLAAGTAAEA
jgi:tRNA uridine 5-carboxymethylaminomethyl modification enzyme